MFFLESPKIIQLVTCNRPICQKHCPFLRKMDSIYKQIRQLQEPYWTILLVAFLGITISLQNRLRIGHLPFKNIALFYSNSIFQKRKVQVYSTTQIALLNGLE